MAGQRGRRYERGRDLGLTEAEKEQLVKDLISRRTAGAGQ